MYHLIGYKLQYGRGHNVDTMTYNDVRNHVIDRLEKVEKTKVTKIAKMLENRWIIVFSETHQNFNGPKASEYDQDMPQPQPSQYHRMEETQNIYIHTIVGIQLK